MLDVYKPQRSSWSVGVASPPDEPVDADFVRLHTNLSEVDALTLLDAYISQARELVELETNRILLATSCVLKLDRFPCLEDAVIELPGGKAQSVDSITYLDAAGVERTWAADQYLVDLADRHGNARVGLAYGAEWPDVLPRGLPVSISYTAGWATAEDVPHALRAAVARLSASLYDERHAGQENPVTQSPWFRAMIAHWRVWKVA